MGPTSPAVYLLAGAIEAHSLYLFFSVSLSLSLPFYLAFSLLCLLSLLSSPRYCLYSLISTHHSLSSIMLSTL